MGFFSWNCTECGHSIMAPYVPKEEMHLNECVAMTQDGRFVRGSYDGYGSVSGFEIDWSSEVQFMHVHCWEKAGKPMEFEKASPDAAGQGYFYDDGNPPERTWRDALEEGDPDFLSVAVDNANREE